MDSDDKQPHRGKTRGWIKEEVKRDTLKHYIAKLKLEDARFKRICLEWILQISDLILPQDILIRQNIRKFSMLDEILNGFASSITKRAFCPPKRYWFNLNFSLTGENVTLSDKKYRTYYFCRYIFFPTKVTEKGYTKLSSPIKSLDG